MECCSYVREERGERAGRREERRERGENGAELAEVRGDIVVSEFLMWLQLQTNIIVDGQQSIGTITSKRGFPSHGKFS